jgi:hypothetical protein
MKGHRLRIFHRKDSSASRALAVGAQALGALAIGALAIGAVAIGRLAIGRARIRRLEIDELIVRKLRVAESLELPPTPRSGSDAGTSTRDGSDRSET